MNNLRIIEGKNVDLITPFPMNEIRRTYGWMHCYRTLTESDDSPKDMDGVVALTSQGFSQSFTWGIIDKNHLTNIRHEAPLVGFGMFEPVLSPGTMIVRGGFFHVATARKAWKTGLIDEAGELVIRELFENIPTLLRISALMLEKNSPAKSLCRRMGFKFEGVLEDMVLQERSPQSMVLFGLTRRNYELCRNHSCQVPLVEESVMPSEELPEVYLEVEAKPTPQTQV